MSDATTNVAIACQGGGSHTAFTAGVLMGLLEQWDEDAYRLVGISGSSGGAFNALAAWYGLTTGDRETAIDTLQGIWDDLAASGPIDRTTNVWMRTIARLESTGLPIPAISPYHLPGEHGKERIRTVLERHIDFESIPEYSQAGAPELVVGTVNVNAGIFETFTNEDVTVEAVLASAAVPNMFEAVEMHGHLHWDGLFSQNPPVSDLMNVAPERKPDELWIIQINPQEVEGEPKSLEEIADRRNELSGNISLNQELRFIERVNQWVEEGHLPKSDFSLTEVRRIQMEERLHCSSKVDRDPAFLADLQERGRSQAQKFLADA